MKCNTCEYLNYLLSDPTRKDFAAVAVGDIMLQWYRPDRNASTSHDLYIPKFNFCPECGAAVKWDKGNIEEE